MAEKPNDSNGKKCYFGRIPAWMRSPELVGQLTGTETKVLFVICSMIGEEWSAWPSFAEIARCANIARRSAIRAVDKLVSLGAVRIEKSVNRPSVYLVQKQAPTGDTHVTTENVTSDTGVTTLVTPMSLPSDAHVTPVVTPVSLGGDKARHNPELNIEKKYKKKDIEEGARETNDFEDAFQSAGIPGYTPPDPVARIPSKRQASSPLKDPTGASVIDKPGYVDPDPADDPDSHVPPAVRELAREFMGKGSWKLISARQRGKVGQYIETSGAARVEQAFRELLRTDERALQAVGLRAADLCHEQTARPFTKPDQPAPRERKMKVV